jgi:hypothetical protein
MLDLDIQIAKNCNKNNWVYKRYSDDILIIVEKNKIHYIESLIREMTSKLSLNISESKTKRYLFKKEHGDINCYEIDNNLKIISKSKLQYLGIEFDGKKISIRNSSISRSLNKIRLKIRRHLKNSDYKSLKKLFYDNSKRNGNGFYKYSKRVSKIFKTSKPLKQTKGLKKKIKKQIDIEKSYISKI